MGWEWYMTTWSFNFPIPSWIVPGTLIRGTTVFLGRLREQRGAVTDRLVSRTLPVSRTGVELKVLTGAQDSWMFSTGGYNGTLRSVVFKCYTSAILSSLVPWYPFFVAEPGCCKGCGESIFRVSRATSEAETRRPSLSWHISSNLILIRAPTAHPLCEVS